MSRMFFSGHGVHSARSRASKMELHPKSAQK